MKTFLIEKLSDFITKNNTKFIYISGNGAAGKSTFAKNLKTKLEQINFKINLIDTDDFLITSKIRKSKTKTYKNKDGVLKTSYFSSSFPESYNLNLLNSVISSFQTDFDDNTITIVEGVGASFIKNTTDSLGMFLTVDKDLEFERRLNRNRNSSDLSKEKFENRREQFDLFVLPLKGNFELELESNKDFSYTIIKDQMNIF